MTNAHIIDILTDIFQDVMGNPTINLKEGTTSDDIAEWDSLSHVRLIVAIENTFDLKFSNTEIDGFECVGDLVRIIGKRTG